MMAHARNGRPRCRAVAIEVFSIQAPEAMANTSRMMPMTDTSSTFPGRRYRRYKPISSAMGMVRPTLHTPQDDAAKELTTTIARIATMMSMMVRVATRAAIPPTRPSSSLAIWPSERPPRLMEMTRTR